MRLIRLFLEHPVPAALLTGDTAPQRIAKLRTGGLPILHKPIAAETLRDMAEQLLRDAQQCKVQEVG